MFYNHFLKYHLIILAIIAFFFLLASNARVDIDDALITYQYARNIAEGNGFVYNEGEHIWGTTTPLYTLVLSIPAFLGVSPVDMSLVYNLLSGIASVLLVSWLAQTLTGSYLAGFFAGLLCSVSGHFSVWAMSGMETVFFTALILAAWACFVADKPAYATVFSALTYLTRPDGLSLVPALLLVYFWKYRRFPYKETALWIIIVLPWFLYALWRFHTILPHSFSAKQEHEKLAASDWMLQYYWESLWYPLIIAAVCGLTIFLRRPYSKQHYAIFGMFLWLVLYIGAYYVVGIDYYEWYCIPPIPVMIILAVVGIWNVLNTIPKINSVSNIVGSAIAVFMIIWFFLPRSDYISVHKSYLNSVEWTRVLVGDWLHNNTPPDAVVGTGAIGHIGYFAQRPVLDYASLVTERSDRPADYSVGHDAFPYPHIRYGDDLHFLRRHELVKRFVPPPPHELMAYKVFKHLNKPSLLPDRLLFRNTLLPEDKKLLNAHDIKLDFSQHAITPYLLRGWGTPEPGWATWTVAKSAAMLVALQKEVTYQLHIRVLPYLWEGHKQRIKLSLNGIEISVKSLSHTIQDATFTIPGNQISDSFNMIEFEFAYFISPHELGRGDDRRKLGVAFLSAHFQPQS